MRESFDDVQLELSRRKPQTLKMEQVALDFGLVKHGGSKIHTSCSLSSPTSMCSECQIRQWCGDTQRLLEPAAQRSLVIVIDRRRGSFERGNGPHYGGAAPEEDRVAREEFKKLDLVVRSK